MMASNKDDRKEHHMAQNSFKDLLKNGGFHAFLWTQFLGAFNDNVYKILVSMRAVHVAANAGQPSSMYLSLAGAVFVLPFLLFSGYSGHLADAISKRKVLIAVKVFEIFVMALGLAVFFSTRIELMLVVLFLMALHSTIFSPAKYGIVPEMLPDNDLSRANALLEMSTFVAIVLGTSIGSFLFAAWKNEPWKMGVVMLGGGRRRIPDQPKNHARAAIRHSRRHFVESVSGGMDRNQAPAEGTPAVAHGAWDLLLLVPGRAVSNGPAAVRKRGAEGRRSEVGLMVTAWRSGIGAGSMLAGRLSGRQSGAGTGAAGLDLHGLFCIAFMRPEAPMRSRWLRSSLLGVASGLFIVPLNAYLQQRSESREKGRIIATNNFYNTVGLLLASAALSGRCTTSCTFRRTS